MTSKNNENQKESKAEDKKREDKNGLNSVPPAEDKGNQDYGALWNKYLRLYADYENARKRWEREQQELVRITESAIFKDIIVISDEVEHALRVAKEHSDIKEIINGLELTRNNITAVLNKKGIRAIETNNRKFDPHFHEIAGSKEIGEGEEHLILEEVQKGYLYEGKVLRTSKVIVSIKPQAGVKKDIGKKEENNKEGLGEA